MEKNVKKDEDEVLPYAKMAAEMHLALHKVTSGNAEGGFGQQVANAIPVKSYFKYDLRYPQGDERKAHGCGGFHSAAVNGDIGIPEKLVLFDPNTGIFRCSWTKAATFFQEFHKSYVKSEEDLRPEFPMWMLWRVTPTS